MSQTRFTEETYRNELNVIAHVEGLVEKSHVNGNSIEQQWTCCFFYTQARQCYLNFNIVRRYICTPAGKLTQNTVLSKVLIHEAQLTLIYPRDSSVGLRSM